MVIDPQLSPKTRTFPDLETAEHRRNPSIFALVIRRAVIGLCDGKVKSVRGLGFGYYEEELVVFAILRCAKAFEDKKSKIPGTKCNRNKTQMYPRTGTPQTWT